MTLARDPEDQERLIDRVRAALELMDAGQPVDPLVLCADCPQLAPALAEVLGLSKELPLLQQAALREDPLAGVLLAGRYRLGQCLGRGSMGVVYRGDDQELHRAVAVKILDVRLFRDPEAERRFQREAEALALLQHEHIVAVFDRGRTPEGIHYLVMELLAGGTLAALLDRIGAGAPPLDAVAAACPEQPRAAHWPRLLAQWGSELARGLAAAHAGGLVHRDVKPSNVFVTTAGRPVLLDFGIAARACDQRLTATQTTLGTPWYMAPEQVRAGGLTAAAPTLDVYGLGATLFHLLAGRAPYEGDAAAVLAALPVQDPPLLARVAPGVPPDLAAIIDTCLERDVGRRYATASALAADLDAFLQHQPVAARPLGVFGRRWRAWRRAPARPLAVAAAVVAVVVTGLTLPSVLRLRAAERMQQKAALLVTLPSVLAVEGWPDERVLQVLASEHQVGIDLLNRILELDAADVPMRLFRACLRLDVGDRAGAASDLDAIARADGSEYLRQLAQRYAAADPARTGANAVDIADLPPPGSPAECYVAGFHELRLNNRKGFAARAEALLLRAAEVYLPARDLRLLALAAVAERTPEAEQAPVLKQLYDETLRLEGLYGGPTARTCALRGVALVLRKEYAAAIPEFEMSLRLRPERHGPHQNLGLCYLRCRDFDRSEHHLQAALRLRPFAWNTKHTQAQLARDRGDFELARQIAAGLAKTGQRGEAWKQPDLLASIELAEAMALLPTDPAAARSAAARAIVCYDAALAVRQTPEAQQRREYAAAFLPEAVEGRWLTFAKAMLADPSNPHQLANLAVLLPPSGLDSVEVVWLGALLRKLAEQQAGDNQELRTRLGAEIETVLRPFR